MSLEVDETFQCNLLIIRVENRIFRAPRELFEIYSEVFKDMFSLPKIEDDQLEGESDEKPLFLDGILKDDFHAFLTALSAFDYESTLKDTKGKAGKVKFVVARFPLYGGLNKDRWIAVLRLSHLWNFEGVRLKAIEALDKEPALVHLERLKLAREFLIEDWVRPVYRHLLTRDEALSEEEVPWIGPDFVVSIAKAREERIKMFLMRMISGEILAEPSCFRCMRRSAMRISPPDLDTLAAGSASPALTIYCRFCEGSGYTLEQVLRESGTFVSRSSIIDGDLDILIDRHLKIY